MLRNLRSTRAFVHTSLNHTNQISVGALRTPAVLADCDGAVAQKAGDCDASVLVRLGSSLEEEANAEAELTVLPWGERGLDLQGIELE